MHDRRDIIVDDIKGDDGDQGAIVVIGSATKRPDAYILIELQLPSEAQEIPEGCYPKEFGPGPHYIYPQVTISPSQAAELRDHLTSLLERQGAAEPAAAT